MATSTVKFTMFDLRDNLKTQVRDLDKGIYKNSNIDEASFRRSLENEIAKIDFKVQTNIRSIIPEVLGQYYKREGSNALGVPEYALFEGIRDYCEKFTGEDIEKAIRDMQSAKQIKKKLLAGDWGEFNKGAYYSLE
jgi:actin-like ATPase involved in cell morphogenesis